VTACLSHAVIDRLLAGELSEREEAQTDRHLRECESCLDTLNSRTAVPDSMNAALASGITRGWDPALTGVLEAVGRKPVDGQPEDIPGYEFLEQIGRGGLGVVFKARQLALDRVVAIKMIPPGAFPAPEDLARFRLEAEAVARLQHPNIVQVFDLPEHRGTPCLCMEYVPGDDLAQRLGGTPQPPITAARLVEILARAIHAVHEAGFLHRDLKPANVLLATAADDESGVWLATADGAPTNAHPKITDFGLAQRFGAESTESPMGLGTPSYMAPEQALGAPNITPAADVYSLGAILYEALTGRPPFRCATAVETMAQVIHEEPLPPSRLIGSLAPDLESICLRCLEKDPAHRYESAGALAEDLRRVQDGLAPVAGREPSMDVVRAKRAEQARAVEADTSQAVLEFITRDILGMANPDNTPNRDLTVREALDRSAERIEGRFPNAPLVEAAIRQTVAKAYTELGLTKTAEPHLLRCIDLRREQLGADHLTTVQTLAELAGLHWYLGRREQALALATEVANDLERLMGSDAIATLEARREQAFMLLRTERPKEAQKILMALIEPMRAAMGQDDTRLLMALSYIAETQGDLGHGDEAIETMQGIVTQLQQAEGGDHPFAHSCMQTLGYYLVEAGRFAEAETVIRDARERYRDHLGANHPSIVGTPHNLGRAVLGQEGRRQEALGILREAVEVVGRALAPDHPRAHAALNTLSNALWDGGDRSEAVRVLEEFFDAYAQPGKPSHEECLGIRRLLGQRYVAMDRHGDAAREFGIVRNTGRRIQPPGHPALIGIACSLADALRADDRASEAESVLLDEWSETEPPANAASADRKRVADRLADHFQSIGDEDQAAHWRAESSRLRREAK